MTSRFLAIDAGNTRIKWGFFDGERWEARGLLPTAEAARLGSEWKALDAGAAAIASNVAGPDVERHLRAACAASGRSLTIIAPQPAQLGVTNGYRDYRQLGADRWAGLLAAHRAHRGHKIVVNAGTALTVDALTADGRFEGGLIVAGPALMRGSLDRGTAGLGLAAGAFDPLPKSTPDAITTGAIQACVGAVERMADAMAELGAAPDLVVLSGGAAPELAAQLKGRVFLEENLVLDGLLLIARAG